MDTDELAAAHAKFIQAENGTPAYDDAWEELVDVLWDRLDHTQPGSKESLRISALILKTL